MKAKAGEWQKKNSFISSTTLAVTACASDKQKANKTGSAMSDVYEEILLSDDQKSRMRRLFTDYDAVVAAMQNFLTTFFPDDPRVAGLELVRDTETLVGALCFPPCMIAAALTHAGMGGLAASCNLIRRGGLRVHGNVGAIGAGACGVVGVSTATAVASAPALPSRPPLSHVHVDGSVGVIGPGSVGIVPSSSFTDETPLAAHMCSGLKRLLTVEDVVTVKRAFDCIYPGCGGGHRFRRLAAAARTPAELVDAIGESGLYQHEVNKMLILANLENVARIVGLGAGWFSRSSCVPAARAVEFDTDTDAEKEQVSAPVTRNLREQLRAIAELHEDRFCAQNTELGDSSVCTVCMERVVALTFGPCGHAVMCIPCAQELCSEDGVWLDCTGCPGTRVTSAMYLIVR